MAPAISVVMSALNAESTIAASIGSIVKQTFQDWELLVFDDGSKDGTAEVVRRFGDPRVRLCESTVTKGLAARLNEGVVVSRGPLIARMDADDVAYPERLARQFAFLREHPDIDLVGSSAIVFSKSKEAIGVFRVAAAHEAICSNPSKGFVLPHPTWLARRAWFERFPYRVTAKRCEDQDVLLRSYATSRFANLPEVLLGYHQDVPRLRHILLGRWHYGLALYRNGREHGKLVAGVGGIATQLLRALVPTVLIALGQAGIVLRHRFRPASPQERERWAAVLSAINSPAFSESA